MLPDFRFALGAFLAVALLFVAGLGLVASARLVQEAHMASMGDSRSLAYAGHPEWNHLYDADHARRANSPVDSGVLDSGVLDSGPVDSGVVDGGPVGKGQTAPTEKRDATASAEPLAAPVIAPARAATTPPTEAAEEKPLDPALLDPRPTAGAPELVAAPPPQPASAPVSVPTRDTAPPAAQVATVPLPSTGAEAPDGPKNGEADSGEVKPSNTATGAETPAQPQASSDVTPDSVWPTPPSPPRPKPRPRRRIARARFHRPAQQNQQTPQQPFQPNWPSPGFPTSKSTWPGFDSQFGPTNTRKVTGKLVAPSNRPK